MENVAGTCMVAAGAMQYWSGVARAASLQATSSQHPSKVFPDRRLHPSVAEFLVMSRKFCGISFGFRTESSGVWRCAGYRLVAPPILWRSSESEDSAGLSPLWGESSSHPQSEPDSWQSNWDPAAVASTASKAFPSLQTGRGQRVFWSLNRGPGLLGKVLYFCTGQWWIQWVVIESKWRKSRNPIKSLEDLIFSAANLIRWSNKIRSAEVTEAKFCESENVFYKYFLKLHRVVDEVARARIRWLRGNTN